MSTDSRNAGIEYQLSMIPAENTEKYLRSICTVHFKPQFALNLSLEVLEAFIDKCTPGAIAFLMEKLNEGNFTDGIARVQAIIDKTPGRK
jgi:hypothetical protein